MSSVGVLCGAALTAWEYGLPPGPCAYARVIIFGRSDNKRSWASCTMPQPSPSARMAWAEPALACLLVSYASAKSESAGLGKQRERERGVFTEPGDESGKSIRVSVYTKGKGILGVVLGSRGRGTIQDFEYNTYEVPNCEEVV